MFFKALVVHAFLMVAQISSYLPYSHEHHHDDWRVDWSIFRDRHSLRVLHTGFSSRTVRSTTDTSGVGTRKAIPVSFPFNAGITFPTYADISIETEPWFDPTDRFCSAGRWRNDILCCTTSTSPILVRYSFSLTKYATHTDFIRWAIHCFLCCCIWMHRSH